MCFLETCPDNKNELSHLTEVLANLIADNAPPFHSFSAQDLKVLGETIEIGITSATDFETYQQNGKFNTNNIFHIFRKNIIVVELRVFSKTLSFVTTRQKIDCC